MVTAKVERASYRVTDRALTMTVQVTNHGAKPVRMGEFMTGSVRFLSPELGLSHAGYPDAYLAESGLHVGSDSTVQPGESKTLTVVAADAAWETEHLASVIRDVDSRFGGLLFFYDDAGRRYITSVSGAMIPDFG
jgi:methane/ammonia monooxygenase subunit B